MSVIPLAMNGCGSRAYGAKNPTTVVGLGDKLSGAGASVTGYWRHLRSRAEKFAVSAGDVWQSFVMVRTPRCIDREDIPASRQSHHKLSTTYRPGRR